MNRNLLLVAISLFVWGIGEGLFFYFQPIYLQELNADPLMIGTILGGMGIAMTVAQIPAGYLSDRFGSRTIMWGSWILGTISAWVMAFANALPVFVVGLIMYGLTSFVLAPMNSYIGLLDHGPQPLAPQQRADMKVSKLFSSTDNEPAVNDILKDKRYKTSPYPP